MKLWVLYSVFFPLLNPLETQENSRSTAVSTVLIIVAFLMHWWRREVYAGNFTNFLNVWGLEKGGLAGLGRERGPENKAFYVQLEAREQEGDRTWEEAICHSPTAVVIVCVEWDLCNTCSLINTLISGAAVTCCSLPFFQLLRSSWFSKAFRRL